MPITSRQNASPTPNVLLPELCPTVRHKAFLYLLLSLLPRIRQFWLHALFHEKTFKCRNKKSFKGIYFNTQVNRFAFLARPIPKWHEWGAILWLYSGWKALRASLVLTSDITQVCRKQWWDIPGLCQSRWLRKIVWKRLSALVVTSNAAKVSFWVGIAVTFRAPSVRKTRKTVWRDC